MALFSLQRGEPAGGTPIVLLHGFGGSHTAWQDVVAHIGDRRHIIAFDLPGHAASLDEPHGSAARAARAVLAATHALGVRRVHWVGHSMGGAAAALAALMAPERAAALTLLAPGGFGPEASQKLLREYAAATGEAEIARLLNDFFAVDVPAGLAQEQALQRKTPGASEALQAIVETFFDGDRQKELPIADLGNLQIPIKVLWGEKDGVLPPGQARRLPASIEAHLFAGAGHMLPMEIPAEAARLILKNKP